MPGPQLVRADVVALPGGGVALTTPRGKVFHVDLDEVDLMDVLKACDGRKSLREVAAGRPRGDDLLELLEMLLREGCLTESALSLDDRDWVRFPDPVVDRAAPRGTELLLVGVGGVASVAADLLNGEGARQFRRIRCVASLAECDRAEFGAETVVIILMDQFDIQSLTNADTSCGELGVRWSYFVFDAHKGRFGPHVTPGEGPNFSDLYDRQIAAARDPALVRARGYQSANRDGYLPPEPELAWMLSLYFIDVARWLAGAPTLGGWHEVELDPVALRVDRHPVLPMPDSPGAGSGRAPVADAHAMLVDRRLGIVTDLIDVAHDSFFPPTLKTVQAVGCDVSRVRPWCNDPVGGGSVFGDEKAARDAAVGEVVERYCGNIVSAELLTYASYDELRTTGEHAVDPDSLVLFSESQYQAPGFPFVPFTRELPIYWVRGRSLTLDRPAWLPASLVYVNWYKSGWGSGAPTNGTFYAGVAAGADVRSSLVSGLQEIVERHATMVWWLNRQPLPGVIPTPALKSLWPRPDAGAPLRYGLIHLDNEFSVPVLAGVVEDTERGLLTIGFAARADPTRAATKAWAEALVLQEISRDLLQRESAYSSAIARGRLPEQGLKPWRADRAYLDDYRSDFHDVFTLICQSQVHLDVRAQDSVRPWVDVKPLRELSDIPKLKSGSLDEYQSLIEARGYEIFYADITTPDVAATGMSVTRTIVPGTVGNFAAAFPFLGHGVIQDSAVRMGWRSEPLAEDELTRMPLPHA